jgi:hypothetical protein
VDPSGGLGVIHHEHWYREAGERELEHLRALILRRDFSVLPEYLKEMERTLGHRSRAVDHTIAYLGDHLDYPDPSGSSEVKALYEEFLAGPPPDHLDWQANPEKNRRKAAVFQKMFPGFKERMEAVRKAVVEIDEMRQAPRARGLPWYGVEADLSEYYLPTRNQYYSAPHGTLGWVNLETAREFWRVTGRFLEVLLPKSREWVEGTSRRIQESESQLASLRQRHPPPNL